MQKNKKIGLKEFILDYVDYYKDYTAKFVYAIIGMILVAGGTSGSAYVIKPILDDIFITHNQKMLAVLPLIVIALHTAKGVGRYLQAYYMSYIGQDIVRRVRDKLLSHIVELDISFFYSKHGGELISRITNDIERIRTAVSNNLAAIITESLTVIALIGVVIYQSPLLAFYGLIVLLTVPYPISMVAKKVKKLSFVSQEKNADITSHLGEIFNNIELIKANNSSALEVQKFTKSNLEFFNINIKAVKATELIGPIMEIVGAIAASAVIYFGGKEVINGHLSVGEFFSFMTALFMLYTPLKRVSRVFNALQDAVAANERVKELMSIQPTILSGNKFLSKNINKIEFENVSVAFEDELALKNINFKISKGQKIALVGDSGGGKSTFVNMIVRFYDTLNGSIKFDEVDIKDINLQDLRNNIAIVTQRVYIFNDTIIKNIAYNNYENLDKEQLEKRVISALKLAHAWDFVKELDNGIYTTLDEFGTNLSGGQRQRIAIARALFKNPQILIFDEATSALDNKSEEIIKNVIDEISKDKITFIIAHRLSTIEDVDKIAVFKDGEIVCFDSKEKLLKDCEEFKKLYKT